MTHTIIDKLERADGPDRELDAEIAVSSGEYVTSRHHPGMLAHKDSPNQFGYFFPSYTASIDAAMMLVPDGRKWSLQPGAKTSFKPFNERTSVKTDSERMEWFWVASVFGHRGESKTPAIALAAAALRARSQGGE